MNIERYLPKILWTRIANSLTGSRFKRNFIKVATANAFSQALPVLVAPILTRLYLPADFGAVALFTSLLGILLAIASMRIDWLVSTVSSNRIAVNVFVLGIVHVVFVSIIILLIKLSGWYVLIGFVNWKIIGDYLWLLPVALIGAGVQLMLAGWFVRVADLAPIANARIRQSVGATSLNILGGALLVGATGLVISATASFWIGMISLGQRAGISLANYLRQTNYLSLCISFKKIWRKYCVSGTTGIVNSFGLLLPTILIANYFTPVELGWYALMQRLATGPIGILTAAVSQSFWAEARQLVRIKPLALRNLFVMTTKRLVLIGLPIVLICLAGPLYVGPVFGQEKWSGAGAVLAALAPYIFAQIVVSTLAPIIVICGEENWLFVWDVVRTIFIVAIFCLSHMFVIKFYYTICAFSLLMTAMYAVLFAKNLRLLNSKVSPTQFP